jgi:hypothetical protein
MAAGWAEGGPATSSSATPLVLRSRLSYKREEEKKRRRHAK